MKKEWFVFIGTSHHGPFSYDEVVGLYENKEISESTLLFKEGLGDWAPLSKCKDFEAHLQKNKLPPIPVSKKLKKSEELTDEPPPIPLDVYFEGAKKSPAVNQRKTANQSLIIRLIVIVALGLGAYFFFFEYNFDIVDPPTEIRSQIQNIIKGVMPVNFEKLMAVALSKSSDLQIEMAQTIDGKKLFAVANTNRSIDGNLRLTAVAGKILGDEPEVILDFEVHFKNRVAEITKMKKIKGEKFYPGLYKILLAGKLTSHKALWLSRYGLKFLIPLLNLNSKTLTLEKEVFIFAGTPADFKEKMKDFLEQKNGIFLKPYQEATETWQTFESLLIQLSQIYSMELDRAIKPQDFKSFEQKFIKEISGPLQSMMTKLAEEIKADINPNKKELQDELAFGKKIGEIMTQMILKTMGQKQFTPAIKKDLHKIFEGQIKAARSQSNSKIQNYSEKIKQLMNFTM